MVNDIGCIKIHLCLNYNKIQYKENIFYEVYLLWMAEEKCCFHLIFYGMRCSQFCAMEEYGTARTATGFK